MNGTTVTATIDGPVATVCLHRPESYNAFNAAMRKELADALLALEQNPEIRVVVLHGEGRGFSAGVDLKEGSDRPSQQVLETEFRPFLECVWNSPKLYIAAVHGHAAGIAAALALACDLVVLEDTAKLTLAFSAIGLVPDGGLVWHLNRALGPKRALAAIVEGHRLDADYCLQHGLVNRVVETGGALASAQIWASQLAECAPLGVSATKRLLAASATLDLGQTFSAEAREQTALAKSSDHKRGIDAFFAGERAVFRGD
jgi:2-(1,2-epoxy-1,2-dihydrophenyl)acetyl-CoA isomerase